MARKHKALPSLEWLQPRLQLTRILSLSSYLGLFLLILVWHLLYAETHGAAAWVPWVLLAGKLLPLLIIGPGLLISGSARAHAWACYVVNLYFIMGVLNAFDPRARVLGWLEVLLSLSLFCAALMYTRWRFQYDRKQAGEN